MDVPENFTEVVAGQGLLLLGAAVQFAVAWLRHRTRELDQSEEEGE